MRQLNNRHWCFAFEDVAAVKATYNHVILGAKGECSNCHSCVPTPTPPPILFLFSILLPASVTLFYTIAIIHKGSHWLIVTSPADRLPNIQIVCTSVAVCLTGRLIIYSGSNLQAPSTVSTGGQEMLSHPLLVYISCENNSQYTHNIVWQPPISTAPLCGTVPMMSSQNGGRKGWAI